MIFKNSFLFFKKKTRSLYLNSNIYNKKISLFSDSVLSYKPSPSLLDCLVKYNKKKIDFDIEIDGVLNFDNNNLVFEAGANILVSGTTIFKNNNGNIKKNIDLLKSI